MVLTLTFYESISSDMLVRMAMLMLEIMKSGHTTPESLRMEATHFWKGCLVFPAFAEISFQAMGQVIPLLLEQMVFSDLELGMLQGSANDWQVPDKEDDIKPRHYRGRTQQTHEDDDGDEADDDVDDDDDDNEVEDYNLRRVSAHTLDDIAEYFGDRILNDVLTVIDQYMQPHQPWKRLEAAILAFGAIAIGCQTGLRPYLVPIASRLLQILDEPNTHFLVSVIAMWALRRISSFLLDMPPDLVPLRPDGSQGHPLDLLNRFVFIVVRNMESASKMVQESATAALNDLCMEADAHQLDGMIDGIIQSIGRCIPAYQLKNKLELFKAIENVCDQFGSQLAADSRRDVLIGQLQQVWVSTSDQSHLICPLFSCMGRVCGALGSAIQPISATIFHRAYQMCSHHIELRKQAIAAVNDDMPDAEYAITAMDLISGLFDALGSSMEPLIAPLEPQFVLLLLAAVNDPDQEIRQSGFAVFADVSKNCPIHVQHVLGDLVAAIVRNCQNLSESSYGSVSNAAYCVSELLLHQVDGVAPTLSSQMIAAILEQFVRLTANVPLTADMRNMVENIILAAGAIMNDQPNVLTQITFDGETVQRFVKVWLQYMRSIKNLGDIKDNAVRGMLLQLQQNSQILSQYPHLFCDLALSLDRSPADIRAAVQSILQGLKAGYGQGWDQILKGYVQREALWRCYGL
jgi:transportin-2